VRLRRKNKAVLIPSQSQKEQGQQLMIDRFLPIDPDLCFIASGCQKQVLTLIV
jgi:hypothetical protein